MAEQEGLFDEETVKALKEIFSTFKRKVVDYLIILGNVDPPEGETPLPHEHEHEHEHLMHGIKDCPTCGEAVLLAKELMRVSEGRLEFKNPSHDIVFPSSHSSDHSTIPLPHIPDPQLFHHH
jgi:ribosomal protein S27AE